MANLQTCRVLVTPTSYARYDPTLRTRLELEVGDVIYNSTGRPLTSSELVEMIPGCDGYIAGVDVIDRQVIAAADRLKVIARYGVGVDNIDLSAAKERGVVVTHTPGANSVSVAELAVGLILSLARPIHAASVSTKAGEWPRLRGLSLEEKVVGLIGLGSIGKEVARRLSGFGCVVMAYDPLPDDAFAQANGVQLRPRAEVVREADFLSLHCPVAPETRGMVDAAFLSEMKAGAFLINTARGELVDETALYEALKAGRLKGAALDAFARQPPGADNPLLALPQVIATPHMGAHTDGAATAMGWGALRDCLAVLQGEQPAHRVI
jgi:D-3-phosphoglycerate dehydrogenase